MYGNCVSLLSESALRLPQALLAKILDTLLSQYCYESTATDAFLNEKYTAKINTP